MPSSKNVRPIFPGSPDALDIAARENDPTAQRAHRDLDFLPFSRDFSL